MKILPGRELRHKSAYALFLTIVFIVAQFVFLSTRLTHLRETQAKIDLVRTAQLMNEKISVQVQEYLSANSNDPVGIAAKLDEQENFLKLISQGGSIDGHVSMRPLSRLARITFSGLEEDWKSYKQLVFILVSRSSEKSTISDSLLDRGDALSILVHSNQDAARVQYQGLALIMSKWYDKLATDVREEMSAANASVENTITVLIAFNVVYFAGMFVVFRKSVLKPVADLTSRIKAEEKGEVTPDEFGSLTVAVNEKIELLQDASRFVSGIGKGNLEEKFSRQYEKGSNALTDSLIDMQAKLKHLSEEEQKRQWSNDGTAKFIEIIRTSNNDVSALCDRIISALIQYTGSNQGALYILNDDDERNPFLELLSLFAWDIRKAEQQKIKPGEGIVGQTYLEGQTTYLTTLPKEYIRITSGLGGANPRAVLIVPLKADERVYGLVELATFTEYQPHVITFVERIGETVASSLAAARANQKNRLLIEQFQQQTEEMRAQEEEMRQNMEELQATQEEMARKERDYLARINELEFRPADRDDASVIERMNEDFERTRKSLLSEIERLERDLSVKTAQSEQWEIAEELQRALRINLEALAITKEESIKKITK